PQLLGLTDEHGRLRDQRGVLKRAMGRPLTGARDLGKSMRRLPASSSGSCLCFDSSTCSSRCVRTTSPRGRVPPRDSLVRPAALRSQAVISRSGLAVPNFGGRTTFRDRSIAEWHRIRALARFVPRALPASRASSVGEWAWGAVVSSLREVSDEDYQ